MFASFLNVFFMLLSRRHFCPIFVAWGLCVCPFSAIVQISHPQNRAEIAARKFMILGGLLGGASGRGRGLLESSDSAEHGEWV